jgi:hypothetical protein
VAFEIGSVKLLKVSSTCAVRRGGGLCAEPAERSLVRDLSQKNRGVTLFFLAMPLLETSSGQALPHGVGRFGSGSMGAVGLGCSFVLLTASDHGCHSAPTSSTPVLQTYAVSLVGMWFFDVIWLALWAHRIDSGTVSAPHAAPPPPNWSQ